MNHCSTAEMPPVLAMVSGKPLTEIPKDLFIPPDALEVLLDSFSGPLDLLLYLIRRENIDILDIPIAHITHQYMQYIHLMENQRLELAADYLVMAALLAEIKSRLLLPPSPQTEDKIEDDPRLMLVRKLQAYEQIKQAAENLDALPRCDRDFFRIQLTATGLSALKILPDVSLSHLSQLMQDLMLRQGHTIHHQITREQLSVRERMSMILDRLEENNILAFHQLFKIEEGRMGLTVSLLAILELARQSLIIISQSEAYSPIHILAVEHG